MDYIPNILSIPKYHYFLKKKFWQICQILRKVGKGGVVRKSDLTSQEFLQATSFHHSCTQELNQHGSII